MVKFEGGGGFDLMIIKMNPLAQDVIPANAGIHNWFNRRDHHAARTGFPLSRE